MLSDEEDVDYVGPRSRLVDLNLPLYFGRGSMLDSNRLPSVWNLYFNSSHMSKKHAELVRKDQKLFIIDRSSLGTIVNDQLLVPGKPYPVTKGDYVSFAIYKLASTIKQLQADALKSGAVSAFLRARGDICVRLGDMSNGQLNVALVVRHLDDVSMNFPSKESTPSVAFNTENSDELCQTNCSAADYHESNDEIDSAGSTDGESSGTHSQESECSDDESVIEVLVGTTANSESQPVTQYLDITELKSGNNSAEGVRETTPFGDSEVDLEASIDEDDLEVETERASIDKNNEEDYFKYYFDADNYDEACDEDYDEASEHSYEVQEEFEQGEGFYLVPLDSAGDSDSLDQVQAPAAQPCVHQACSNQIYPNQASNISNETRYGDQPQFVQTIYTQGTLHPPWSLSVNYYAPTPYGNQVTQGVPVSAANTDGTFVARNKNETAASSPQQGGSTYLPTIPAPQITSLTQQQPAEFSTTRKLAHSTFEAEDNESVLDVSNETDPIVSVHKVPPLLRKRKVDEIEEITADEIQQTPAKKARKLPFRVFANVVLKGATVALGTLVLLVGYGSYLETLQQGNFDELTS